MNRLALPPIRLKARLTRARCRFAVKEGGSVALMFALMLPVLFGIVGLGVEAGLWFKERRQLQNIADTAAVSAAIELAYGATSTELMTAAKIEADGNGFDPTSDTFLYVGTPTSGTYAGQAAYVEVRVERKLETMLSQVFYSLNPLTTSRAVAGTTSDMEACVMALSNTSMNSIYLNGAGTKVTMTGCGVVANSDHSTNAINIQNGSFEADCLWSAGGISGESNITTACPTSVSNAKPVEDPFASLDVPAYGACDFDPPGVQACTPAHGDTLSEGVYCGGLEFSAGSTVTMADGIYVIDEGNFKVNGGAHVTGNNVTIILTASDGTGTGTIQINGGATVDLAAATGADTTGTIQGDYTGVLFYQDRTAGSSPSMDATLSGGSTMELMGAVYLPNNDISFSGGNNTTGDGCLMLVSQSVSFNGDANIENKCDMFGGNPIAFGARPGLVE